MYRWIKLCVVVWIGLCVSISSLALQWEWFDPLKAGFPVVQNQGFGNGLDSSYCRLPERAKGAVPESVWKMSRRSTGLAIHFYTNSPCIQIRCQVGELWCSQFMPMSDVSGLDLYCIDCDGSWHYCSGDYSLKDTVTYFYDCSLPNKYHTLGYEFRLYLPYYNEIKWLEIGIQTDADLDFIPVSKEKPIVLYGAVDSQAGAASRTVMAWGSVLQRMTGRPLVDLGFLGINNLEEDVLEWMNEFDACLYILDCVPNLYDWSEEESVSLLVSKVKQLRKKRKVPILLLEHTGLNDVDTLQYRHLENMDQYSRNAYEQLCAEGIPYIYYLSCNELELSMEAHDGIADYPCFNMEQYIAVIERKVREILNTPVGDCSTTRPVTQHRCTDYDWCSRHNSILEKVYSNPPIAVILGNSITHYWGGEPEHHFKNGLESWNQEMAPLGFLNLGFAWDRIENVLWRVYHGELEGYEVKKIVLMIGINNVDIDTNEDILTGIRFLFLAIRQRQPKAQIKVVGLLPCRGQEQQVKKINIVISQMAYVEGFYYSDPGKVLLLQDGKIDESLFTDGTHPNEEGYRRIVKGIVSF